MRAGLIGLWLALVALPAAADPEGLAAAHWSGCASCHGEAGEGLRPKEAPGIAGQDATYIERQMRAFRSGLRGRHPDDGAGSRMTLMAAAISDDKVLSALSRRIAAMPPVAAATTLPATDVARARRIYPSCAVCHGAAGQGGAAAPRLAGIGDWYLLAQLRKFRDGVRGYQHEDAEGQRMAALVAGLSDDDLRAIASYGNAPGLPP
jgi:cytochrome c oxidase subunit 2